MTHNCMHPFENDTNFYDSPVHECTGSHLVAVGSEDCTVSLVRLCPRSEDTTQCIKVVATLQGHISSVRALSCSPSVRSDGRRLLFSGGARASLKVWSVGPGMRRHLHHNFTTSNHRLQ